MTCGNRRSINYGQKPDEVIAYVQSFLDALLGAGTTCTSIVATSIAADVVFIVNETIDLATANWQGQFFMTADGNGIVEINAMFANGESLFDYFHICTTTETVVL